MEWRGGIVASVRNPSYSGVGGRKIESGVCQGKGRAKTLSQKRNKTKKGGMQWLMSITPATWEVKIGRVSVQGQLGKPTVKWRVPVIPAMQET
jgi:hypothetical protein